jgi:hypothetical protein
MASEQERQFTLGESVIETVNGHQIRRIRSERFGWLFAVDGTDKVFATMEEAREFARR